MDFVGITIWAVLVGLTALLLLAIANGRMSGKGSGAASITAFHDMQPRDKQNAIEVALDQKAGKRWAEQQSGMGPGKEEPKNEENES